MPSFFDFVGTQLSNVSSAEAAQKSRLGQMTAAQRQAHRRSQLQRSSASRRHIGVGKGPLITFKVDTTGRNLSFRKLNAIQLFAENLGATETPLLTNMGNRAVGMLRARMRRGVDLDERPFAQLSSRGGKHSYAEKKRRFIRQGVVKVPSGSVRPPKSNLFLTGKLQRSLRARAIGGKTPGVSITAPGNKGLADILNSGTGRMPARPFLGLTAGEKEILTKQFIRNMRVSIGKEILRTRG